MILSCQNICKSFGEKIILKDASFHIEDREKAALIGNNGAGKTTLLRIIMHELSPDSGNVVLAKDKNIGYLAQYQDIHGHHTIYEELISTKQHIIDMENRLRSLEQEMKYVAGDKLESLMNSYTRLTHQFELENGYAYKIRKLFGIENRNLSKTEETYLKMWHDKFLMDEDMVELAYEYCIMQTTKLSFPYINSILKRWHELNIHNVADAKKDHEDFKTKNKSQKDLSVYDDNNINYDELEEIMRDKM